MDKKELAEKHLKEFKHALDTLNLENLNKIIDILLKARSEKKQIFIFGNGGSAALSSHLACDLNKGTLQNPYDEEEKRFRAISLADNIPLMTACSNDLAYEYVFSQQLKNLIQEGDIVIAISSSGNSKNVLNAVDLAKKHNAATIGFTGFGGGRLKGMVDIAIVVDSYNYGIVEDTHSALNHIICSTLKEELDS